MHHHNGSSAFSLARSGVSRTSALVLVARAPIAAWQASAASVISCALLLRTACQHLRNAQVPAFHKVPFLLWQKGATHQEAPILCEAADVGLGCIHLGHLRQRGGDAACVEQTCAVTLKRSFCLLLQQMEGSMWRRVAGHSSGGRVCQEAAALYAKGCVAPFGWS